MKKLLVIAAAAAVPLCATPALAAGGSSWATNERGDASVAREVSARTSFGPWRPFVSKPFTAPACNTRLAVTYPVNKEEIRTRLDSGGNEIREVRGPFVVAFTPVGTKRHYIFDVGGVSRGAYANTAYRNGDFLFAATGGNFFGLNPQEQRQTGLVRPVNGKRYDIAVIVTQGPVRILFHGQPELADVITRPTSVIDVCRLINN